ncbi:weak similarity to ubiquinone/menaquinone biosynthesis methyl transferase [Rubellimicrobium mesophilum DSM 19309]|uniref:Weak similarity to ubiquinone/menaquinone biosynthesis methyl transferase n=1 Tax=Rubellimicrobium mesophilum DSM 19309 TaxID=442562 RepID=A0A017HTE2_9RHOB|nr:class I SAM-dependent methyltransferase [Rubellimicrobium mesophilum]EYD77782.1 weak similarity to ubiquinone/menaquinone biosynthesis methyl transferase [Rubellimicrobium mesophilum DSM 19309]
MLDAGCGTGVGGDLLHALGYRGIVGFDMSEPMMERAARLGAYAELVRGVLGEALPFPDGRFAAVMAAGVFTLGHAPAASLRELVRVTRPGGRLLFSVRDVVHDQQGFREEQAALEAEGEWRLLESLGPVRAFTVREPHVLVRLFACERL